MSRGESLTLSESEEVTLRSLKTAARQLRTSSVEVRNAALRAIGEELIRREGEILAANREDLAALSETTPGAFRDRLTLNAARLQGMRDSLEAVERLPDPIGEVAECRTAPNGLLMRRVRSSLGVLFMIYESRPNVAIEAFSLALKSGNALILRGGKESARTVGVLYAILRSGLVKAGLPEACLWGITDPDRELVRSLLQRKDMIDVVVPRGGERLIDFVVDHSRIPIIKNDRGLCHLYVHEDADLAMALELLNNGKTQRPGVCNALESVLVHESIAPEFLSRAYARLSHAQVRWFCEPKALQLLQGSSHVFAATDRSFDTEYLDFAVSARVVSSLDQALEHIEQHGSRHSEVIVTRDETTARRFHAEVDAAAVYWNASSRFTDGYELGLGGELGISTQKLHVRGPVGLRELTSLRWTVDGKGQIRG